MRINKLLTIFLIVMSFTFITGMVSAGLTDDIYAYYKFDGNTEDSVGSLDLTNNGAGSITGKINQAYTLANNDYMTKTSFISNAKNNMSYSFWFKANSDNQNHGIANLSYTGFGYCSYEKIAIDINGYIIYRGSPTCNNDGIMTSDNNYDFHNGWNHIAVTVAGSTFESAKIYLNGELIDSTYTFKNTDDRTSTTYPRTILSLGDNLWGGETNGSIDEFAIWDRTLTTNEIKGLYNSNVGSQYPFTDAVYPLETAHYTFNETSGTTLEDISGNDYNGTNNGATINQTGKINKAYSFDGSNDYIYSSTELELSNTLSVCEWIYYSGTSTDGTIFEKGASASDYAHYGVRISQVDNNIIFYAGDSSINNITANVSNLNTNAWNHICAVKESSASNKSYIYINGSKVTTGTLPTDYSNSTTNFNIGTWRQSFLWFNNKIDDMRLYDFDLNTDDISLIYNSGNGTEEPLNELRAGTDNSITNPTAPLYTFNSYDWNLAYQDEDYNSDYTYKYSFGIDSDGNIETGTPIYWDTNQTLSVSDENLNYYTLDHDTNSSTYDDYYSFATIHRYIDSTYEDSTTVYSNETLDIIKNLDMNIENPGTSLYVFKDYDWDYKIIENSYNSNKTYKYDFGINTAKSLTGAIKYRNGLDLSIDSNTLKEFTFTQDVNDDYIGQSFYSYVTLYTYENLGLIDTNTVWSDNSFTMIQNLDVDLNRPDYPDFANRLYVNVLYDYNFSVEDESYDSNKTYDYNLGYNLTTSLDGNQTTTLENIDLDLTSTSKEFFTAQSIIPQTYLDENIYAFITINTYDNDVLIDEDTFWTTQFYVGSGLVRLYVKDENTGNTLDNVIVYNSTVNKYYYGDDNGFFQENIYEEGLEGFQKAVIYREEDGIVTHPRRQLDIVFSNSGSFDGNVYLLDNSLGNDIEFLVNSPDNVSWANKYFIFRYQNGSNVQVTFDELIDKYDNSAVNSGFQGVEFHPTSDIYLTNIEYTLDIADPANRVRIYNVDTGLLVYESALALGSTSLGIPLETLVLDANVDYSIVFDGNGVNYRYYQELGYFNSGDINGSNVIYTSGCDNSYTSCTSNRAFNLTGLDSIDKSKYDSAKAEPFILLTQVGTDSKFTGFVAPDGNYTAFLIGEQGNLEYIYYKSNINVKKPKDEKTDVDISPYDITVGGLLNYELTNQSVSDLNVNIFAGTTGYYNFTVVDYNASIADRKYIPRTYALRINMDSNYTRIFNLQPYLIQEEQAFTPTIIVVDQLDRTLGNALIIISKYIDGKLTVVESPSTDSSGAVSFSAYPNDTYYVQVIYNGVTYPKDELHYTLKAVEDLVYTFKLDLSILTLPSNMIQVYLDWGDTKDTYVSFDESISITNAELSSNASNGINEYQLLLIQNDKVIDSTTIGGNLNNPEEVNYTFDSSKLNRGFKHAEIRIVTTDETGNALFVFNRKIVIDRRTNPMTFFKNAKNDMGQPLSAIMALIITAILIAILTMSGLGIEINGILILGTILLGIFMWWGWFDVGHTIYGFMDYGKMAYMFFAFAVAFVIYKGGMR